MEVKLHAKPGPLTRFMMKYWVLGVIMVPFCRFVPRRWLIETDTEVVRNG